MIFNASKKNKIKKTLFKTETTKMKNYCFLEDTYVFRVQNFSIFILHLYLLLLFIIHIVLLFYVQYFNVVG